MLLEANVVGKKTDWANYITLSDEHETPLLKRLPKGPKPVNVVKHYQADTYEDPAPGSHPEGKPWTGFKSAGANRVELVARCQYFVETASVGKLAQDVTDTAGVPDELAREITKKMTIIARKMEASAGSDQPSFKDNTEQGHMYRGLGKWIQTGAQSDADLDVDATIRPGTNQVITANSTAIVENNIRDMMESAWTKTGMTGNTLFVCGSSLKKLFDAFQFYLPSSTSTQSTARVSQRQDGKDGKLGNSVGVYESTWGRMELELSKFLAFSGFGSASATAGPWRGYMLHPEMWEWNWNQKPTVYKPEYRGGSYQAAIEAILMLLCKNPLGEGKVAPADVA